KTKAETKHASINLERLQKWQGVDLIRGQHTDQSARAPIREPQSNHAAGQRKQDRLSQQLLDDAPSAGAESNPNSNFLLSGERAGEQKVRDISARNQQHKADRAEQDHQNRFDLTDDLFL